MKDPDPLKLCWKIELLVILAAKVHPICWESQYLIENDDHVRLLICEILQESFTKNIYSYNKTTIRVLDSHLKSQDQSLPFRRIFS